MSRKEEKRTTILLLLLCSKKLVGEFFVKFVNSIVTFVLLLLMFLICCLKSFFQVVCYLRHLHYGRKIGNTLKINTRHNLNMLLGKMETPHYYTKLCGCTEFNLFIV